MKAARALTGLPGLASLALTACLVGAGGPYSSGEYGSQPATGASATTTKSVAIFGTQGVAGDEAQLLQFLREYPLAVTRIDLISSHLTDRTLAAYDVILLDHMSRTFEPDEAAALEGWVRAGGSLMSLCGYANSTEDVDRPNSLLAKLPIMYLPGIVRGDSYGEVSGFGAHPAMTGVRHVPFWAGYRVEVVGACDTGGGGVVASLDDRTPVGVACQHGAGRVLVWGDEWVEYSSQWSAGTDAPRFWKSAFDWLLHRT
jgi:hypothetical protein